MSIEVRVYGAPGCHLCDEAKRILQEARGQLGFDLVEVDISGDPELERRFREQIPVVFVDGLCAFTFRVDPARLRERVEAATSGPSAVS
ncbi:MAG TPA: glutaredoxin family protein [Gaiellales bacterium]|nr:glutaredoxin family protein [Gaiellales bacterium]